tara:strand:+ start:296 stop:1063 length:768 start_codon:yes stop_codon:yes gene_type:complete
MATKIISHKWKLKLPNSFLVDHSFSDGKERECTYDGPDKIYLQIGADGKEHYGPLTEDDIADGRPKPVDVEEWFEVDCAADDLSTLICQLRGPVIDEREEERGTDDYWHPGSPDLGPEYARLGYSLPLMADDVYDSDSLKVEGGKITISAFTARQKINGADVDKTWDDVREQRNKMLSNSDGEIAEDMPEDMKTKIKAWRQKLRDFPKTMLDNGVEPNVASMMMPNSPMHVDPPKKPGEDGKSGTASDPWAPPAG